MHRTTAVLATLLAVPLAGTSGARQADTIAGTWTAEPVVARRAESSREPGIHLQLRTQSERGWSNNGFTVPLAAFTNLPPDRASVPDARFELRRDAGTFRFEGQFRGGQGLGEFRFEADAGYRQMLAGKGETRLDGRRLLSLALMDVSRAFIAETEQAFPGIGFDDIVAFRIHGVTPEFRAELARRGFTNLSPDDLVKARIHRVTPEYVDQMRAAGYASADIDGLVRLRIHGVSEEYMQAMAAAGYRNLTPDDLAQASIHRVQPDFVRALQQAGYSNVPLDDLVKMRIHRVTPDYISALGAAGYSGLSIAQLVQFRIHGIDAKFIEDLKAEGYTGLSARELVDIRIHARRWLPRRR
jgi:hypothetical protein